MPTETKRPAFGQTSRFTRAKAALAAVTVAAALAMPAAATQPAWAVSADDAARTSSQGNDAKPQKAAKQSGYDNDVEGYMGIISDVMPMTPDKEQIANAIGAVTLKSFKNAEVEIEDTTYDGGEKKPAAKVTLGNKELAAGDDYAVSYADNVDSGVATATLTGLGKYYGTATATFAIAPADISKAEISGLEDEYYETGEPVEPAFSLKAGGQKLVPGRDYTVFYSNNVHVGRASAKIQGKGNYTGETTFKFKILPDNAEPVLEYSAMMIDVDHFNFADMTCKLSTAKSRWKESDIEWKIADASVASFQTPDGHADKFKGPKAQVEAVEFGETEITATLPNGNTATCKLKVISTCEDSDHGEAYRQSDEGTAYYLVEGTWGDEFVEAYVNNAEKMVEEHPEYGTFGKESPARNVYVYKQKDLEVYWPEGAEKFVVEGHEHSWERSKGDSFDEEVLVKKEGDLSPNDWLLLATSKNQWQYLLHKDSTGKWKVDASRAGSMGPYWGAFNGYMGAVFKSEFGLAATYSTNYEDQRLYTRLIHSGGGNGKPTSGGCIHLGNYDNDLYYDTFTKAGGGTRVINY